MTTRVMPKPHRDRGIEGRMAKWYASTTLSQMKEFRALAQQIGALLPEAGSVLEVAPGPGYLCIELAKLGRLQVTGLDLSHTMVKIAREKAQQVGAPVHFEQGSASSLPFPRDSFDLLVCRAAFKNFALPVRALEEMHRVLKPGGRALIIDLRRDASPATVSREVDRMKLSPVNRAITKLTFRFMLLKSAYTKEHFEQMLAQTQFSKAEIGGNDLGFEIWLTK